MTSESLITNDASGGDGIPAELFKILKDDGVKVLYSICQQNWKTAVATRLEKSVFFPNPKQGSAKKCSNYWTIVLASYANKIMLKIFQAKLQQNMN